MSETSEHQWVSLEVARLEKTTTFRGRIASADLIGITRGNHELPFVKLTDVHWVERVWNESERQSRTRVTAYGQPGEYERHTGEMFLRPENVLSIAILTGPAEVS